MNSRKNMLFEDRISILKLIQHIDSEIVRIRKNKAIPEEDKKTIRSFYDNWIVPWMEDYNIDRLELSAKEESVFVDALLDFITVLKKIQ